MDGANLIEKLDEILYVTDPDTYELLFANESCRQLIGTSDYRGEKCYRLLQGRQEPCEFCTEKGSFHWASASKRHYLQKGKLIQWKGKAVRLEVAMDVTKQENQERMLRQRLFSGQALVDCIRRLMRADSLEQAIQSVLSEVGAYYGADRVSLVELEEGGACAVWPPCDTAARGKLPWEDGGYWSSSVERCTYIDSEQLLREYPDQIGALRASGIHSLLTAPLLLEGRPTGGIAVENPKETDGEFLHALSCFAAIEFQRRRLLIELEYQNGHDALTGLFNRFQYLKYLDSSRITMLTSLGVVFCDINGLKQINDLHGHSEGDRVIIRVAQVLCACFPERQIYRLSGDEFVVLCENVAKDPFEKMVREAELQFQEERNGGVSMGSVWQEGAIDLRRMADLADAQMYEQKRKYYRKNPRRETD